MSHFYKAILPVLKHEGGFVDNPNDPGGATKWGISQRTYPLLDIRALTEQDAIAIYKRDFWAFQYDRMPYVVAAKVFDMAVNMGAKTAAKILQRAVEVVADGIIGPATIKAIESADEAVLLGNITLEQLKYYKAVVKNKPTTAVFMAGWTKRANWHPTV
jgi:lysozyme family protein